MNNEESEIVTEREEDVRETDPLNTPKVQVKPSVCAKFRSFISNITIEPCGFLYLTGSMLAIISSQTLNLEKACRVNLALGDEVCDALRSQKSSNYSMHEKNVQEYVAIRMAWRSIIQSVLPCLILPFVGAWSDRTGRRKTVFLLPIFGDILQCISAILNVVFFYQLPVEVLIFFDAFFPAIAGGWSVTFLGLFSYVSDITSVENRTYRIGFLQMCIFVGIPIGIVLSGVLLKNFGYFSVYGTALCLHIINLFYVFYILDESPRTQEQIQHDGRGLLYFLRTFFDLSNIRETMTVVFKKGPNKRRLRVIVLLLVVCLLFGPMYGEISVLYMSTRYRFNWDEVKYSVYQTYNFVTHSIGTVFSLVVFSKLLKWHDSILGIISTLSKIAGSFVYCFAPNDRIFYLGPLVEILNGTSLMAMRSIISKLVASDELGKVNSIISLTENLMPLLYVPLYTRVYTATMDKLPGFVFLMGASMTIPAVMVFCMLFWEHRKGLRKQNEEKSQE